MSLQSPVPDASPAHNDVPWWLSIGLPYGSAAGCLAIALLDTQLYERWIVAKESGYVEVATVVLLLFSGLLSAWLWFQLRGTSRRRLMVWLAILFAGTVFWAGEEVSWGQHVIGWTTPEIWQELNEQQETNLHNIHSTAFDTAPRAVLLLAAIACVLVSPFHARLSTAWPKHGPFLNGFLPTTASLPAALLVIALFVLDGLKHFAPETLSPWLNEMLTRDRIWELQEYVLSILLLLYLSSWCVRWVAGGRSSPE